MKRIIIIFGIIFLIFIAVVLFQVSNKSKNNLNKRAVNSTVTINSITYKAELAKTPKEQVDGLSGRGSLPKDTSMLFIFDKPSYYSFWMRGMKFPLDIIFILNNKVVAVYKNLPQASATDENPHQYGSNVVSNRVLEINAGEAEKNNIKVGDPVIINLN